MSEERLRELLNEGISMPAKLLIEKKDGTDGNVKMEITGNIVGIMTLSNALLKHIGETIAKHDLSLLDVWSQAIMMDLAKILVSKKEESDED